MTGMRTIRRAVVSMAAVACLTGTALAQNGRLLDSTPITLGKDAIEKLEATRPGIRAIVEDVDVSAITYLSDGLKVKGYMATPKHGEKVACGSVTPISVPATLAVYPLMK